MTARKAAYDEIGSGYGAVRRGDPRIAAAIHDALGPSASVVNVGAGTGNYEPDDRWVLAVEPSATMISQRPAGAAPVVVAPAEALPLATGTVDAAMALLSVHHWRDVRAGLHELRRVARHVVVVFTVDPARIGGFWLVRDYLPEIVALDRPRFPALSVLREVFPSAQARAVPVPADCADGFLGAYWARPEAYLDASKRAGMSAMRQLDPGVVDRALAALAADLDHGAWDRRHGHLREGGELDLGYRLIVAPLK